jgi:hypothetical protein
MTARATQPTVGAMPTLPDGVYASSLDSYKRTQAERVPGQWNLVRAQFAEHIVAELLGGEVVLDPSAAWDVSWTPNSTRLRVQVKCSGERLPHHRESQPTKAEWNFPLRTHGWDPETGQRLGPGPHFDLLVLARHEGWLIDQGWSFYVLRPDWKGRTKAVRPSHLEDAGEKRCDSSELRATALSLAR